MIMVIFPELMNRNIGKSLNIIGDTILSIYASYGDSYRWLIGAYENVVGEFITHTGFGSIGAMENFVYRDSTLLGSLTSSEMILVGLIFDL